MEAVSNEDALMGKLDREVIDTKLLYAQMAISLKDDPLTIMHYKALFDEIFCTYDVKLQITGVNRVCFISDEKVLTNFGAIVLGVKHLHQIESVQFDVDLLIVCQHEEPKIVNVNSLELKSGLWIEKLLGVTYQYEAPQSIQTAIKIMAGFAPMKKIYHYSGWALDTPNTYILGGVEICAKNYI